MERLLSRIACGVCSARELVAMKDSLKAVPAIKSALACLSQARYGIGWGVLGAAMSCYETARQYTQLRKQFADRPIASHQLVQAELAWMITEISKAQLLALHVGRLKDRGKADCAHISMLKRNNVWIALETAGGILRALPGLDEVFWVMAGDVFAPGFGFAAEDAFVKVPVPERIDVRARMRGKLHYLAQRSGARPARRSAPRRRAR